jgi:hypothetical protein
MHRRGSRRGCHAAPRVDFDGRIKAARELDRDASRCRENAGDRAAGRCRVRSKPDGWAVVGSDQPPDARRLEHVAVPFRDPLACDELVTSPHRHAPGRRRSELQTLRSRLGGAVNAICKTTSRLIAAIASGMSSSMTTLQMTDGCVTTLSNQNSYGC